MATAKVTTTGVRALCQSDLTLGPRRLLNGAHVALRLGEWNDRRGGGCVRKVAVKEVSLTRAAREALSREAATRLSSEAALMNKLRHSNVLRCFGACEATTADGEKLLQVVTEECTSTLTGYSGPWLQTLRQLSWAMHHVHAQECIHRDLKPDNVFLSSAGSVKLADFDRAVLLSPGFQPCGQAQSLSASGFAPPKAAQTYPLKHTSPMTRCSNA